MTKNAYGKSIEAWTNQNWKQIREADMERVKSVRTSRYGFGPTSEWREPLSVETSIENRSEYYNHGLHV